MARQKSEFLSAFGTAFEIFKGIADEVLNLGGSDQDLRKILKEENLRKEIAKLVLNRVVQDEVFTVTINYDLSLEEMIGAGKYNCVNQNITRENFPVTGSGQMERRLEFVHFGRTMSTKQVLDEIKRRSLHPAKIEDLLAFGVTHPDIQRQFPIAALGSVWRDPHGNRVVPYLDGLGSERFLDLDWDDGGWSGGCRFLAACK